jgi:hypothetical protein
MKCLVSVQRLRSVLQVPGIRDTMFSVIFDKLSPLEVWGRGARRTVRHEASEIPPNNAMPGRALSLVKL